MPPGDPSAETSAARVATGAAQTAIKRGDLRADTDLELALDVLREPLIVRAKSAGASRQRSRRRPWAGRGAGNAVAPQTGWRPNWGFDLAEVGAARYRFDTGVSSV